MLLDVQGTRAVSQLLMPPLLDGFAHKTSDADIEDESERVEGGRRRLATCLGRATSTWCVPQATRARSHAPPPRAPLDDWNSICRDMPWGMVPLPLFFLLFLFALPCARVPPPFLRQAAAQVPPPQVLTKAPTNPPRPPAQPCPANFSRYRGTDQLKSPSLDSGRGRRWVLMSSAAIGSFGMRSCCIYAICAYLGRHILDPGRPCSVDMPSINLHGRIYHRRGRWREGIMAVLQRASVGVGVSGKAGDEPGGPGEEGSRSRGLGQ